MNTTKEALVRAMEDYFHRDTKRINHAHKVTEYAEELLKREGGDYPVVIGASVLHELLLYQELLVQPSQQASSWHVV